MVAAAPFPYRIVVAWSASDGVYVARVPALGVAAHGELPEDAAREARIACEAMLAALRENGRPIPSSDAG